MSSKNNEIDLKKVDILLKKVRLTIKCLIKMAFSKRGIKSRSSNALFNPYKIGISSYDMTCLSSEKIVFKNKNANLPSYYKKEYIT